jgi:Uma2 family endonuclease
MTLALKQKEKYTYGDYLKWPDDERWELIEGIAYDMSPAPTRIHQKLSLRIERVISDFLEGGRCELYHAPFDVRFPDGNEKDEEIGTVVQPDIVVVCGQSKLDDAGCRGAPDLIIEILSESTAAKDMNEKLFLYEKHGVKEYWIVNYWDKTITTRHLAKNGKYSKPTLLASDDLICSKVLKGLEISVNNIFKQI